VFSHDISRYLLVVLQTKWCLQNCSMDPWMCSLPCLWWCQICINSDIFRDLGHVIWLLVIEIYELGKRFWKVEISQPNDKLLCLLWLTRLNIASKNWIFSGHLNW